jgi:RNA polymerase sigma factor (sigma-70 family)
MTRGPANPLLRFLRKIANPEGDEPSDGQLLKRFVAERDEEAFALLVRRHGPMVLEVCRGVLRDGHDAEDAFQATFLVLVRKAGAIGKPQSVGSFLYGVAYRVALKARAGAARRRERERQVPLAPVGEPMQELISRDLRPVLHEEVNRLPERYRAPFVLCYLEGRTNEEAARLLGWPKGTVLSSLSRARERLRGQLTRRGLAITGSLLAGMLASNVASAAIPPALAETTARMAKTLVADHAAALPASLATLMRGAAPLARWKVALASVLVLGAVGLGVDQVARRVAAQGQPEGHPPEAVRAEAARLPAKEENRPVPDEERLVGTWECTRYAFNDRADENNRRNLRLVITRDSLTTVHGSELVFIAKYQLDSAASPKAFDFTILMGENKDKVGRGIYELAGDQLQVRYVLDGDRPRAFLGPEGFNTYQLTWKRVMP